MSSRGYIGSTPNDISTDEDDIIKRAIADKLKVGITLTLIGMFIILFSASLLYNVIGIKSEAGKWLVVTGVIGLFIFIYGIYLIVTKNKV